MKAIIGQYISKDFPRLIWWTIVLIFTAGSLWAKFGGVPSKIEKLEKESIQCQVSRAEVSAKLDLIIKYLEKSKQ